MDSTLKDCGICSCSLCNDKKTVGKCFCEKRCIKCLNIFMDALAVELQSAHYGYPPGTPERGPIVYCCNCVKE